MEIQSMKPAKGARTKYVRVGRGIGSGIGKTSGRGTKGQHARNTVRPGFEGGQIPLVRKLAIRGFNNKKFAKVYSIVNVGDLAGLEPNTVVDEQLLYEIRIVGKREPYGLKVLGNGELNVPLTVRASKFTKSAIEKIEKAGGKIEVI